MFQGKETFFTVVGCMDGRCQELIAEYGRRIFGAQFADTITDAGIVGLLANNPSDEVLFDLKTKLRISSDKHKSRGVLVYGHSDCAGDPVNDITQKDHVLKAVAVVKGLVGSDVYDIPVYGIFIKRLAANPVEWITEKL